MVGFEVQMNGATFLYGVGTGEFLGAFFDTVAVKLEGGKRGERFPTVFALYRGERISFPKLLDLRDEVNTIHVELKSFLPNEVIWDMDDSSKRPPWGNNISNEITDLSNYFVTCGGKQLFSVLLHAIHHAVELKSSIIIKSTFEH